MLSGGRLAAGLGMGWMPEEHAAAGVPYERRGARMDEYLRCLEALWTQDPVEFTGDFYTVPRSHVGPPPVQRPHPPVLLGGSAAPALQRAGRLAQGWIASSRHPLAGLAASIATVREGARAAGRDPDALQIVVRRPLQGTRAQFLDDLAALAAQGVTEVILDLNFTPEIDAELRGACARRVRPYAASTFGMMSSLSRLRSSSVLATGTSANGGHSSGIVSPASW